MGAGIQDFTNQVVDFAGSDAAMNDEEIAKVKKGAVLLPMTAGEIVLTFNLKGVKELKLPRSVYPEIFLGKIAKWNDPKIAEANPGVSLPDDDIIPLAPRGRSTLRPVRSRGSLHHPSPFLRSPRLASSIR
jgi:phosphate transport system substrate-binding protein